MQINPNAERGTPYTSGNVRWWEKCGETWSGDMELVLNYNVQYIHTYQGTRKL